MSNPQEIELLSFSKKTLKQLETFDEKVDYVWRLQDYLNTLSNFDKVSTFFQEFSKKHKEALKSAWEVLVQEKEEKQLMCESMTALAHFTVLFIALNWRDRYWHNKLLEKDITAHLHRFISYARQLPIYSKFDDCHTKPQFIEVLISLINHRSGHFLPAFKALIKDSPVDNHELAHLFSLFANAEYNLAREDITSFNQNIRFANPVDYEKVGDKLSLLFSDVEILLKAFEIVSNEMDKQEKLGENLENNVLKTCMFLWYSSKANPHAFFELAYKQNRFHIIKRFVDFILAQNNLFFSARSMDLNFSFSCLNDYYLPLLEKFDKEAYEQTCQQVFFSNYLDKQVKISKIKELLIFPEGWKYPRAEHLKITLKLIEQLPCDFSKETFTSHCSVFLIDLTKLFEIKLKKEFKKEFATTLKQQAKAIFLGALDFSEQHLASGYQYVDPNISTAASLNNQYTIIETLKTLARRINISKKSLIRLQNLEKAVVDFDRSINTVIFTSPKGEEPIPVQKDLLKEIFDLIDF